MIHCLIGCGLELPDEEVSYQQMSYHMDNCEG